nr:hypothetical protein CDS [Bradyrhizobium sp.]
MRAPAQIGILKETPGRLRYPAMEGDRNWNDSNAASLAGELHQR